MPLPKHFTSSTATPKSTLQALAVKLDRFCLVDYALLSDSFHATRASLKVRWKSGQEQQWSMTDVGCHSQAEAENFVATMALHELAVVEGKGDKGVWRTLPTDYRDLWDELDTKRKQDVDRERRATWGVLRAILETRLVPPETGDQLDSGVNVRVRYFLSLFFGLQRLLVCNGLVGCGFFYKPLNKSTAGLIPGFDFLPPPPPLSNLPSSGFFSEQIKADFERRQATPNYQNMLV